VAIFPDDQRAIPTEDGSLPAMGYWYGNVNDIYVARNSQVSEYHKHTTEVLIYPCKDAWINIQWYYRRVDLEDECVESVVIVLHFFEDSDSIDIALPSLWETTSLCAVTTSLW
jgi:hypothetical protein